MAASQLFAFAGKNREKLDKIVGILKFANSVADTVVHVENNAPKNPGKTRSVRGVSDSQPSFSTFPPDFPR